MTTKLIDTASYIIKTKVILGEVDLFILQKPFLK